jgi:hypothetical protein
MLCARGGRYGKQSVEKCRFIRKLFRLIYATKSYVMKHFVSLTCRTPSFETDTWPQAISPLVREVKHLLVQHSQHQPPSLAQAHRDSGWGFSPSPTAAALRCPALAPHLPRICPAVAPPLPRRCPALAPRPPRICPAVAPQLPRIIFTRAGVEP